MGSSSREAAARVTDVDTGHSGGSASLSTDVEGEEALVEEAVSEEVTDETEASEAEPTEKETEATADDENADLTADEPDSETESSESDPEAEPTEEELAEIEAMAAAAGGSGHNGPPTAIITGSSNVMINGLPAARLGDILEPHHPGVRTICEGTPSVLINGQPASRVSDAIDCGGTIATGSDNVFIGDSPTLAAPSDASLPDIVFPNERSRRSDSQAKTSTPATAVNAEIDTVSYTNTTHTNDTNVRIEGSISSLANSKQQAIDYWNTAEINATSFPEAFGARLMRLNAETGYDAASGAKNLYETLTDWNKFKSAVDGMYNTVANPKETYKAFRAAAQSFSDLPGDQKGEAAYKMLLGTLAGGGVAKSGRLITAAPDTQPAKIKPSTLAKRKQPGSLIEAQAILQEQRKKIAHEGYHPKYNDSELAALAQLGDVGNERFHVRLMETRHLVNRDTPNVPLSGALGTTMEGATGKGAKYWSTTFDQLEDADTDPKLIAHKLGIDYKPGGDYALIVIDTDKAKASTEVKSVPATFTEVSEFANTELPDDFPKNFTDKTMTPEFQQEYLLHYKSAVDSGDIKDWSTNPERFEKYLTKVGMEQSKIDDMKLRMSMHNKVGNNHEYLGNGLTKNLNTEVSHQYGAVETLNFERKEINLQQLQNADAISIITELKPI